MAWLNGWDGWTDFQDITVSVRASASQVPKLANSTVVVPRLSPSSVPWAMAKSTVRTVVTESVVDR